MQSRLAAGDLNQRVTLRSRATSTDAAGQVIESWSDLATNVPAKVESVTGGETIRGRQVSAEAQIVITVRYRTDVTTLMRVVYESQHYGIVRASDPYGDRRELRIEAKVAS